MVITFFGDFDYVETPQDRQKMMWTLTEVIGDRPAKLYFGGNGAFDEFAFNCCWEYKKINPNIKLVNVKSDIMEWCEETELNSPTDGYDKYFFPPMLLETPRKFAASHRNFYMVEKAHIVIFYIKRENTAAYNMYEYAHYTKKITVNLAQENMSDVISVDIALAITRIWGNGNYSLTNLFRRFRAHKELLEDPDYKRLYDEILEESYKNSPEQPENKEGEIALHEAVGDLMVKDFSAEPERISAEPLTCLLKQRKRIWNLV